MNDCSCGWVVIAAGSIPLGCGRSCGGSLSGSCGSAAMNSATSIDTSTTMMRSICPVSCPATEAPITASASATRKRGDSQLFTFYRPPFIAETTC